LGAVVYPTFPATPVPGAPNQPLSLLEIAGILGLIGRFMVIIGPIILVIAIIYGGILFMFAGASGALVAKAKSMIGYGIVGGLIVFGVGVIINTLINVVTRQFFCTFGISIPGLINICIF
jgi:hypothetical protein